MEKKSRRKFSADFKAKIVIEALKERNTIEQIAKKHELHPNQITTWKREFLDKAAIIFASEEDYSTGKKQQEDLMDKLYSQIGQQKVEIDWLKKKLL